MSDLEAPEADAHDQAVPVDGIDPDGADDGIARPSELPLEADEADAVEQAAVVEDDADEYR